MEARPVLTVSKVSGNCGSLKETNCFMEDRELHEIIRLIIRDVAVNTSTNISHVLKSNKASMPTPSELQRIIAILQENNEYIVTHASYTYFASRNPNYSLNQSLIAANQSSIDSNESLKAANASIIETNRSVKDLNSNTKTYYKHQRNTAYAIAAFTALTLSFSVASFVRTCGKNQPPTLQLSPDMRSKLDSSLLFQKAIDSSLRIMAKDSSKKIFVIRDSVHRKG